MLWNEEVQVKGEVDEEEILDKAETFAQLLKSSPEFQAFLKAQEELMSDDQAQEVIMAYQEQQQAVQMSRFYGGIKQKELEELNRLRRVMLENPTVKRFFQAQEEMVILFQEVSSIISDIIGMDYAAACAPAGGCC